MKSNAFRLSEIILDHQLFSCLDRHSGKIDWSTCQQERSLGCGWRWRRQPSYWSRVYLHIWSSLLFVYLPCSDGASDDGDWTNSFNAKTLCPVQQSSINDPSVYLAAIFSLGRNEDVYSDEIGSSSYEINHFSIDIASVLNNIEDQSDR